MKKKLARTRKVKNLINKHLELQKLRAAARRDAVKLVYNYGQCVCIWSQKK